MRKAFAEHIALVGGADHRVVFLTGDLGFMALEGIRESMGDRFINVGVCEQNMISLAAGLASEGLIPVCYSIAPFAVFRPAEQIRNDICQNRRNVKIVGNGGGYGYGIMGPSHHALEDLAVMSAFAGMQCYIPYCAEDVVGAIDRMLDTEGPSYLRLGAGRSPSDDIQPFSGIRKLRNGDRITIVSLGPISLNVLEAIKGLDETGLTDVFAMTMIPLKQDVDLLLESLKKTGILLVCEEHVARGGMGEYLSWIVLRNGINCRFYHRFANGYPDGLYGSQAYHREVCGLDPQSINSLINDILNGK